MLGNAAAGLILALLAAQAPPAPGGSPADLSPPRIDDAPVEVTLGFYALDFARVTAREESFDVTGYLEQRWRDPSLALASGADPGHRRRPRDGEIWLPRILFENALDRPRDHAEPVTEVDDWGNVTRWAILSARFSSPMDGKRFPFDRQELTVRIGSVADASTQAFRVARDLVRVGPDAFVSDWTIGAASALVDSHRYVAGQAVYVRYVYRVGLTRRSTFYIWRVMLPLSLLALVSWAAFWFEPVGLQPQISTCMAALIALVAFHLAVDFSLPKVANLTLIDKHALIGFGFVATAVAAVTAIHVAVGRDRLPLARSIQKAARWLFLPAYGLAVAWNLAATLG